MDSVGVNIPAPLIALFGVLVGVLITWLIHRYTPTLERAELAETKARLEALERAKALSNGEAKVALLTEFQETAQVLVRGLREEMVHLRDRCDAAEDRADESEQACEQAMRDQRNRHIGEIAEVRVSIGSELDSERRMRLKLEKDLEVAKARIEELEEKVNRLEAENLGLHTQIQRRAT